MSRRAALALSFTLTVVVAFAVASFASQAGWLQAQSDNTEAATVEDTIQPQPVDYGWQEPLVITEYVYQDIPVVVTRGEASAPPEPTPVIVPAQVVSTSESSVDSTPTNAAASPVNQQPEPQLSWSYDGDGEDDEDFHDEHEDEHEHEHESEHEDDD